MAGIYIHIPFCRQACHYCDFHFSTLLKEKKTLLKAICAEIKQRHNYLKAEVIESIYFGGGTPSLLSESELALLFENLRDYFLWNNAAEITLEANPDDIDATALKVWKKLGINRLSIGLQSFNDEELRWMNRAHNAGQSLTSVKMALDAGFSNLTIDLIYGSRFQTTGSWEKTLKQALALGTPHISAYNLTIEDRTALGVNFKKGKEPAVNDELSSNQFLLMKDVLEGAGFVHYEISSFAKPGYFAQHNSNYWQQKPYLGLGPSAHSFNGQSRQWNTRNNPRYIALLQNGEQFFEIESLEPKHRYNEYVLTRLRTIWGCDEKEITTLFGSGFAQQFKTAAQQKKEWITEKNGVYTLNRQGLLLADGLASHFFVV